MKRVTVFVVFCHFIYSHHKKDCIREYICDEPEAHCLEDGSINVSQLSNCHDPLCDIERGDIKLAGYVDSIGGHIGYSSQIDTLAFFDKSKAEAYYHEMI